MKIPSCKNFEAKEGMGVSSGRRGRRGRIHLGGEGETPQNRGAGLGQPHPDPTNDEQHDRLPERAVPPTQRFFIKYGGKELDHLADRVEERFQFEFLASTKLVATHVTSRHERP